jgi:hypothetical protein
MWIERIYNLLFYFIIHFYIQGTRVVFLVHWYESPLIICTAEFWARHVFFFLRVFRISLPNNQS